MSLFTPLEQFDEVTWLSHRIVETLEPYVLFVCELEFGVKNLYLNAYDLVTYPISFTANVRHCEAEYELISTLAFFFVAISIFPVRFEKVKADNGFFTDFAFLFFLAFINLATGFFFRVWFTDFFFMNESIDKCNMPTTLTITTFNYLLVPQIDFSFSVNEMFITLILGYFLFGGNESEDEQDYLLFKRGDLTIVEEVVAPLFVANLGKDIVENGSLYLKVCSVFGFVLISNLLGRVPFGDTATSSLILTFWVALSVFSSLVTLRIRKHGIHYFFSLFRPSGCPLPLIFLLIPIEFLSYSFRLVSLSVRLFANRRAGHTLRKVLIGFSYVRFTLGDGYAIAAFLPALVVFVLIFLERAVAGIQAYIFTILTCIYLKDLYVSH